MWEAVISNFVDEEHIGMVTKVCEDISKKDESFKFKKRGMEIILMGSDRNKVARKASWLIHKADPLSKIVYKMEEAKE